MYRAVLQYHVHTERLSKIPVTQKQWVCTTMKFCHCYAMVKGTHVIHNSN